MIPFIGIIIFLITLAQINNGPNDTSEQYLKNLMAKEEFNTRNLWILIIFILYHAVREFIKSTPEQAFISIVFTAFVVLIYHQSKNAHLWIYSIIGLVVIILTSFRDYLSYAEGFLYVPYGLISMLVVFHLDKFKRNDFVESPDGNISEGD